MSSPARPGRDLFTPLYSVMEKYGVTCSPDEFQRIVNVMFHKAESQVYDEVHSCMWESLPQQFGLLTEDFLEASGDVPNARLLLDIGCGTGLSTELLLNTRMGKQVIKADLLDTCGEMLEKARSRARNWPIETDFLNAAIDDLVASGRKYDIIVVCSVIHHIPDLATFFRQVRAVQARSGILLHLQDPNGDHLNDAALRRRMDELSRHTTWAMTQRLRRFTPKRAIDKIKRRIIPSDRDYIQQFNDELLALGVVTRPMARVDIWTVTDIHVHDGQGVSVIQLRNLLEDYRLISTRSYGFFGRQASELPQSLRAREQQLVRERAQDGLYVGAVWQLKDAPNAERLA